MTRREAREVILKMLFETDFQPDKDKELIIIENLADIKGKVKEFIKEEYNGTIVNIIDIDDLIKENTENWSLTRIAKVDLNLLRMATYEIVYAKTPEKIAVSEAVELAKVYSTDKSPVFINGILAKIIRSYKNNDCVLEVNLCVDPV